MAIDFPKTEKDFFLEYPSFKNVDYDIEAFSNEG